jgi:hypothetical protein
MNFFKLVATKITNAYYLVFRSPVATQLRVRKLKDQEAYEGSETLLSLKSYADLKNYQRKARIFMVSIIVATILVIIGLIFGFMLFIKFFVSIFSR